MNLKELEYKRKELKKDYLTKLREVEQEYAFANNPYQVGDIVYDHIGKAKLLRIASVYISAFASERVPTILFEAENYTKAGKVSKRLPIRNVYQENIICNEELAGY